MTPWRWASGVEATTRRRWAAWALQAVGDHGGSARLSASPDLWAAATAHLRAQPALRHHLSQALGPSPTLLTDHCWVRHQRPPALRGPGHTPHSWHQDGALGFDFAAAGPPPWPADAMADLVTCWLTLDDCGLDAPSLAWLDPAAPTLWPVSDLADDAVAARTAAATPPHRLHHAVLAAGEALLFGGGLVHRTHATDAMTRPRTSLEWRWCRGDAVPTRLAGGTRLAW